jgi:hypothetical protein
MPSVTRTPRVVRANGDNRRAFVPYGWFSFRRVNELVPFKGLLARDYLTLAVLDPEVFHISKSVRSLPWWDGSCWREHWPRYAVHRREKYSGAQSIRYVDLIDPREDHNNARLYNKVKKEADFRNIEYNFADSSAIMRYPLLTNARIIQSRADPRIVDSNVIDLIRLLSASDTSFTLAEAIIAYGLSYEEAYTSVLHLVALGELWFDLDQEFCKQTALRGRPR